MKVSVDLPARGLLLLAMLIAGIFVGAKVEMSNMVPFVLASMTAVALFWYSGVQLVMGKKTWTGVMLFSLHIAALVVTATAIMWGRCGFNPLVGLCM